MKTIREIEIKDVDFQIIQHEEHIPVKGNAIASDDAEYDKKVESNINRRLSMGQLWAWCTVEVRASFGELHGSDFLGCCSCSNEKDFIKGGYYEDMKARAFEELQSKFAETLKPLEV